MRVEYFPKLNPDYSSISGRVVAYAVLLPDVMPTNRYWIMSVHGISERSGGTKENLENLVLGSKQADGTRKWPYVTDDMKRAVDMYGIIMLIPTYEGNAFFDAARFDWVYKDARTKYNLHIDGWGDGFSYGGGAALNAITSALTAPYIAFATPCAPTKSIGNIALIGQNKTVVHIYVNDEDDNGSTNLSVTKGIIADINKTNPPIPAVFTAFRQKYHGGHNEAMTIAPPVAPGGQGLIDAVENNYEHFLSIMKDGPRQMKTGTVIQPPAPAPIDPPTVTIEARVSYTIDTTGIHLIGDKSIGYKSGMDGRWEFVSAPTGVTKEQVFPGGSTYINADGKLPKPGTYKFQFFLKGVEKPVDVTVEHGQAAKTIVSASSTSVTIVYSDATTEQGSMTYTAGKVTFKNSAGQVIA